MRKTSTSRHASMKKTEQQLNLLAGLLVLSAVVLAPVVLKTLDLSFTPTPITFPSIEEARQSRLELTAARESTLLQVGDAHPVAAARRRLLDTKSDLHNVPRSTLDGSPGTNDPTVDVTLWAQGLLLAAAVGPIFLAITICVGFWTLCCRCICNCAFCGKRSATRSYTRKEVIQMAIAFGLICILGIIFCIVGFAGNGQFRAALESILNKFVELVTGLRDDAVTIDGIVASTLSSVPVNTSTSYPTLAPVMNSVLTTTEDLRTTALFYDDYRMTFLLVGYLFALAGVVIGVLTLLLRKGGFAVAMSVIMILSSSFLWVTYTTHYPTALAIADVCVLVDQTSDQAITDLVPICANQAVVTGATSSLQEQVNATQSVLDQLKANNKTNSDPNVIAAQNAITNLNTAIALIEKLVGCAYITDLVSTVRTAICVTMLGAADMLAISSLLLGLLFLIGFPFTLIACKRLDKNNWDDADSLFTIKGVTDRDDGEQPVYGEQQSPTAPVENIVVMNDMGEEKKSSGRY